MTRMEKTSEPIPQNATLYEGLYIKVYLKVDKRRLQQFRKI